MFKDKKETTRTWPTLFMMQPVWLPQVLEFSIPVVVNTQVLFEMI